eukprot:scaffold98169_cov39-Tisochrysis_lutea.AAC.2
MEAWVSTELHGFNPRRGAGLRAQQPIASRVAGAKKGRSLAYQQAVTATIWHSDAHLCSTSCALTRLCPGTTQQHCSVEKSLSVDNLFVFLMIFDYFKVPEQYTQRVLKWGILTALLLRGVMIALGVAVVERFRPVLLLFALILVFSAIKMLKPEEDTELSENTILKLATSVRMWACRELDRFGHTRTSDVVPTQGVRKATPLLVVLIMIELSDVIFAVDSIPAVVGITHDPLVVYSSNIFALMALRSLYLILSKSVQSLFYLRHAVALILLFVGVKMSLEFIHVTISAMTSLAVILVLLASGVIASIARGAQGAAKGHSSTSVSTTRHAAFESV